MKLHGGPEFDTHVVDQCIEPRVKELLTGKKYEVRKAVTDIVIVYDNISKQEL